MKPLKGVAILIVLAMAAGSLSLWYKTVMQGGYLATAGMFLAVLAISAPALIAVCVFYVVRAIMKYEHNPDNTL